MNLKVLFVIATDNIGGQELSLFDRIQGLRKLGIHCEVLLSKEGRLSDFLKRQHIPVHSFELRQLTKKNPLPYLKTVIRIIRLVKKERFNIIHCSGAYPHQYCLPAARFCNIPCVVHVNSTVYSERGLRISFIKHADLIVAISEAVKTNILNKVKMDPQKIRVIHDGILDEEGDADVPSGNNGADIKRELGIAEGVKIVGQIGNAFPEKGLEYFIQMAGIIKDDSSLKVKFLIIGQTWQNAYWTKLKALIDELGLGNDVIFTGFKSDIQNFINILDVSVLASIVEGHGRALVESLALGKAVVGTNVGGIPETIIHNRTGLLVEPRNPHAMADAVSELLTDQEKARRLARNGQQFVLQHFTLRQHAQAIYELYKQLLKKSLKQKIKQIPAFILNYGWIFWFKRYRLKKINLAQLDLNQYPLGSVIHLHELTEDKKVIEEIEEKLEAYNEYVLGEIDQEGRFFSEKLKLSFLKNISQDEFVPRKRYQIQVVVLKGKPPVIAIKKNFNKDTMAALKEVHVLTLLEQCQVPKLLGFSPLNDAVYMSFIAGENLKDKLSDNSIETKDLDLRLKQNLISDQEKERVRGVLERIVNYQDVLNEVNKINACGVVLEDIKYGNFIIEKRTQKPFWIDFHAAKINGVRKGFMAKRRKDQMVENLNRIFFHHRESLAHV